MTQNSRKISVWILKCPHSNQEVIHFFGFNAPSVVKSFETHMIRICMKNLADGDRFERVKCCYWKLRLTRALLIGLSKGADYTKLRWLPLLPSDLSSICCLRWTHTLEMSKRLTRLCVLSCLIGWRSPLMMKKASKTLKESTMNQILDANLKQSLIYSKELLVIYRIIPAPGTQYWRSSTVARPTVHNKSKTTSLKNSRLNGWLIII